MTEQIQTREGHRMQGREESPKNVRQRKEEGTRNAKVQNGVHTIRESIEIASTISHEEVITATLWRESEPLTGP